jgi:hypothetical protein
MIKLLSVKTRRPDSTREAFRRHYEERHVPLGLSFIHHFRWRKYARNHVVAVHSGQVDFDCLTEFWFANRADHASTGAFAATPEFRVLDEDDARFLDPTRRLAFELEERLVAGDRPAQEAPGTRRLAAIFERPEATPLDDFARRIAADVDRLAATPALAGVRLSLDRRAAVGPRPSELGAIVSAWAGPGALLVPSELFAPFGPQAVVELEVVETPAERLWPARENPAGAA